MDVKDGTVKFTEKLTDTVYERNGKDIRDYGLYCIVNKWDAQIFYY